MYQWRANNRMGLRMRGMNLNLCILRMFEDIYISLLLYRQRGPYKVGQISAAVERLPVLYHSADYISFPLESLGPLWNI